MKIHKIILGLLLLTLVVFIFQSTFNGKKMVSAINHPCPAPIVNGNGSSGNPCQITNWFQLQAMNDALDHNYILMNNLDAFTAGYINFQLLLGFEPVGDSFNQFTGTFNGSNFHIIGLFIDRSTNYIGLFGGTSSGSVINNVDLVNVNITGISFVGGLIGRNDGAVSNSYSSGDVTGQNWVGGLVGRNDGVLNNSYSTSSVTGTVLAIGGLVGTNIISGVINNSYSSGDVTGGGEAGGLVGRNDGAVSNSYSVGFVSGVGAYVGGLIGRIAGGGICANSFWDTQTSGQPNSACEAPGQAEGKTTVEMTTQSTFNPPWDFTVTPIWKMISFSGFLSYPCLEWQADSTCALSSITAPVLGSFLFGMTF